MDGHVDDKGNIVCYEMNRSDTPKSITDPKIVFPDIRKMNITGCGKHFINGQWWKFCGERDMESAPKLYVHCGGDMLLEEDNVDKDVVAAFEQLNKKNHTLLIGIRKV